MCLIVFSYHTHPKYKFILAANRDEFYARPTAQAHWWDDHSDIVGGRDLLAKGTWMALNSEGRFSAVTNFRDLSNIRPDAKSRGDLPVNFLVNDDDAPSYADKVFEKGSEYNGFNLISMDEHLTHISNYGDSAATLKPGTYGLSNALLDTPWPKVTKAKSSFQSLIQKSFDLKDLIDIMQDEGTAEDELLPNTGLDYAREKALSAMCIRTPDYGTCCSTAITIDYDGNVEFLERSYPVGDRIDGSVDFSFKIQKA